MVHQDFEGGITKKDRIRITSASDNRSTISGRTARSSSNASGRPERPPQAGGLPHEKSRQARRPVPLYMPLHFSKLVQGRVEGSSQWLGLMRSA